MKSNGTQCNSKVFKAELFNPGTENRILHSKPDSSIPDTD